MEALLFTYLRTGFFASVMILAVLLLRPLLRKAPRNISCVLWLLVILRLLLPFQLESPLSLQPQLSEPAAVTAWEEMLPVTEYEPITDLSPSVPSEPIQQETPLVKPNIEPETVMTVLWGCGMLAVLLYVCISYGALRYRVRDAVKCPEGVWESDRIGGAFLLGYCKPKIYIPTELNLKDRRFILAHEQSHLKRGDHWWKLLGMICLSIHWYNPLVWLSYALLCRDIEVACDERVIRDLELEERKSYSFALLNCGKRLSGFLTYPVAFGEVSLKTRIKKVLNYRKPSLHITATALIMTVVVALCFMTTPTTATVDYDEPEQIITAPVTEPEPETQPPAETTAHTEPPVETTAPTEPEPTQPTVTEPTTPEPSIPSVTVPTDFTEKQPTDTSPQLPTFEPPDLEEIEFEWPNDSGGISLIPKEPAKTGVELPSVSWDVISPKPGYPAFP